MKPSIHNIDEVIELEIHRTFSAKDPYLQQGAAGIVVFLMWMYSITKEEKYKARALDIMDNLGKLIPKNPPIEINNGVTGIAIISLWLKKQGLLSDDIDDIVMSIDDYIYRNTSEIINSYNQRYDYTALDILLYIPMRLTSTKDINLIKIYKRLWFKLFIVLSNNISLDFFIEKNPPELKSKLIMFLFICHKGSNLSPEIRHKIFMTLTELQNYCLSFVPRFAFNRLLLHRAVKNIIDSLKLGEEWKDYEKQLRSALPTPTLLTKQMLSNDMYLTHGIPCVIMFMRHSRIPISRELRELSKSMILESELYKMEYSHMEEKGYVGLDGILGAIMALAELESYSYDEI